MLVDQASPSTDHMACCHNCDRTYPCFPHPDLPTSFLNHQNHPRTPNATPEPSGSIPSQLASQQCTPEHSDSLASSRCIPDPMLLRPFLFLVSSRFPTSTLIPDPMLFNLLSSCIKSIPDVSSVLRLRLGFAQSRTSLAQCVLVCLFSPSIYLYVSLCLIVHYPSFVPLSHPQFPISVNPCLIYLYSISPSTLLSYPVLSL